MTTQAVTTRRGRREEIRRRLQAWIRRDGLQPGDRLLPQRELAKRLETSEVTTHRILSEMAEAGEVHRIPGQGTFLGTRGGDRGSNGAITLVLPTGIWISRATTQSTGQSFNLSHELSCPMQVCDVPFR